MLDCIRSRSVPSVVAYEPQRIARDPVLIMGVSRACQVNGVQLHFVHGPSGNTDAAQLVMMVDGWAGRKERALFAQGSVDAKLAIARSGRIPVGALPYGYRYDKLTGLRHFIPEQAALVRSIFHHLACGRAYNWVSNNLNAKNTPSQKGELWHPLTIRRLARNGSYIGIDCFNRSQSKKLDDGLIVRVDRPREEWIEIRGYSPIIVDSSLFKAAHAQLAEPSPIDRGQKDRYLLTGHIFCPLCGSRVCGGSRASRTGARRIRCRGTQPQGNQPKICSASYMDADTIESDVWADLCAALRNPDNMIGHFLGLVRTGDGEIANEIASLKRDIDQCCAEESRFMKLFGLDEIDQEILLEQIAPIKALREDLTRRAMGLEEQQRLADRVGDLEARIREYCAVRVERLDDLDWEGKRETLAVRVDASIDGYQITAEIQPFVATIARTLA